MLLTTVASFLANRIPLKLVCMLLFLYQSVSSFFWPYMIDSCVCTMNLCYITGPPTHSVGGGRCCFARRASVVVCWRL